MEAAMISPSECGDLSPLSESGNCHAAHTDVTSEIRKAATSRRTPKDKVSSTISLADAAARPWDALVIGAGPAGATAAKGIADHGLSVLLVDSKPFPRSKVCGGCLNQHSLSVLRAAGMLGSIEALAPLPLHQFRLASRGRSLPLSLPGGVAVSRAAMDAALVEAAIRSGSHFLPETVAEVGELGSVPSSLNSHPSSPLAAGRTVALDSHGSRVSAVARVVVVAAGLGSRCLARVDGFRSEESASSRIGVEAMLGDFPAEYEPGVIFMAVGRSGYVGLTRVEDGRLNVAAAVDRDAIRRTGRPAAVCEEILNEAGFPVSPGMRQADWHGTIGLTRRSTRRAGERLFLVGDAAGYVEPFTGEGMAWALSSGLGVIPFVCEGVVGWRDELARDWEHRFRRLVDSRQWLCRALALGLRRTYLVRSIIPILSHCPWLARPVIRRLNQESEHVAFDTGPGDGPPCAHHDAGRGAENVDQHHLPG
jgi:flavin-dependent dehydrogenase